MKYFRLISAILITALFIALIWQGQQEANRKAVINHALKQIK